MRVDAELVDFRGDPARVAIGMKEGLISSMAAGGRIFVVVPGTTALKSGSRAEMVGGLGSVDCSASSASLPSERPASSTFRPRARRVWSVSSSRSLMTAGCPLVQ